MNAYEACATVEAEGQVRVTGVPFAPGTQVAVVVSRKRCDALAADDLAVTAARARMRDLFATVRGFRNAPQIPREELYERGSPSLTRTCCCRGWSVHRSGMGCWAVSLI